MLCGDINPNPGPNTRPITVCHANIRSLKANNNFDHVSIDLAGSYDIIVLTETWLTKDDNRDNFHLPGYQAPIRLDRAIEPLGYGGIIIWVKNDIAYKRRKDLEDKNIEMVWLEVRAGNNKFLLCSLYRANSNTDFTFWDRLQDNIDNISCRHSNKIMMIGDLNADLSTPHGAKMKHFTECNDLTIHVNTPTRITSTSATILDQIISNFPRELSEVKIESPVGSSDHCSISVKCNIKVANSSSYTRTMWSYSDEAFDRYRKALSEHEWKCLACEDINEASTEFTNELLIIAKSTIPNKIVTIRTGDKPWFNNSLRRLRRKRNKQFQNMKKT